MTNEYETYTLTDEPKKTVGERIDEGAEYVAHKADDVKSSIGGAIKSAGDTVRTKGPHEGIAGTVSSSMADTLESTGAYLQTHGLSDAAEDLTNVIRRHPVPSLFVAMGMGFLFAQACHRQR